MRRTFLTLSLPLIAAAVVAVAQSAPPAQQAVPTFGTTTELVYMRFHVEKKGGYLASLDKGQIRVLEDGRPQAIAVLETPSTRQRTIPPEVTLALDVSSSVMDERLLDESLVRDVLFANLSQQARVGLCAFGGELRCPTLPTREVGEVLAGFGEAMQFAIETRNSGTRLYDSIAEIAKAAGERGQAQRAMIVFSDGLENQGGRLKDALQAARDADVRIYTVTLSQAFQQTARTRLFGPPPSRTMFDYKKLDLGVLAEDTGGRNYEPGTLDPRSLARIVREIATEITMENVVGYQPEGPATGRRRKVKVELVDRSLGRIPDGERTLVR